MWNEWTNDDQICHWRNQRKIRRKVIVVGAHLDSWDVGEGAHDDGAGIVQSIEVLRTFKNLKLKIIIP